MSEFMDWHKKATAVSTALYAEGDRRRLGAYSGFLYGVGSALTWASEQEPTDAEVEAAAKAFHDHECVCGDLRHPDFPEGETYFRDLARAALIAAQKVRAGQ
ncbi:hypothetical protein ACUXNS_000068 [Brevibacterium pityocampae]